MALRSELFRGDTRLHCCAVSNSGLILPGASGSFVSRLQSAMLILGDQPVDGGELEMGYFGASTRRAIMAWQRERLLMPRRTRRANHRRDDDGLIDCATMRGIDADMVAFERRARLAGIPV